MDSRLIVLIVILFIIICIAVVVTWLQEFNRKMNRQMRNITRVVSGVGDIVDLIKENEQVIQTTPKTLSMTESLYLDKIKKDFPELNISLVKSYANEIVSDYLRFLNTGNDYELKKDCTENFITQAESYVDNKDRNSVKFHKTAISGYKVESDEATITIQTSCQYINESNKMVQTRYELSYVYYLEETPENRTISLKCPNCGGPIEYTGQKICKFCGCGLVDTIKRTWKFDSIKEF